MMSKVFEWFEAKPMASGSVAQVHKAILGGEMVAVKVRLLHSVYYPSI